jgi:predicted MFS family arabinose efflux permease
MGSRVTTRPDPSELIDSPRAWVVAAAAGLVIGTTFGTAYTFGSFFEAMASEFGSGRGATAVMVGLTLLLSFGFGIVSGPLSDRHDPRLFLAVGGLIFCGGLVATSQVRHLPLGYLTYGGAVGLGGGIYVTPAFATVGALFRRHRAMALGLTATGNGVGTLVLVPAAQRLIDAHGWREAYLWLALIAAVVLTGAIAVFVTPPREAAPPAREHRLRLLKDANFRVMFASTLLMAVGLFVAFTYIVPFARDNGVAPTTAARLVSLIGLSSIVGRLGTTSLSRKMGAVRLYQMTLALQPIAYLVWLRAGSNLVLLVVFVVLLGVSYGGFVALGPEVAVHLFGSGGIGGLLGLTFLATGLGGFVGPPLAGWLSDAADSQSIPIISVIVVLVIAIAVASQLQRSPANRAAEPSGRSSVGPTPS